jgi:glycosyltransferase involved in cell wall biosynthesis
MKVSVVVCSIGRETLFDCLNSLKSQNYEDFETIVVSFEKSIEDKVRELKAKFVLSPKANVSFQRNLGIKESEGEFVCFIDDDAIAENSWIKALVECFTDDQIACVGGKINLMVEDKIPRELQKLSRRMLGGFLGETMLDAEKKEIKEPLLWGSNICFRKKIFDEVGYFDERIGRTPTLPLCNEEIEIQERILKGGFKIVYEPRAIVWHKVFPERLTVSYFLQRAFWQGYSEVVAARRHENIKEFVECTKVGFGRFLMREKIFENIFETLITEALDKKILKYKKIGRTAGFLELANSE